MVSCFKSDEDFENVNILKDDVAIIRIRRLTENYQAWMWTNDNDLIDFFGLTSRSSRIQRNNAKFTEIQQHLEKNNYKLLRVSQGFVPTERGGTANEYYYIYSRDIDLQFKNITNQLDDLAIDNSDNTDEP